MVILQNVLTGILPNFRISATKMSVMFQLQLRIASVDRDCLLIGKSLHSSQIRIAHNEVAISQPESVCLESNALNSTGPRVWNTRLKGLCVSPLWPIS
jgi:hypothetical protein